ncbi:MAG: AAA family ATPase [Calothrix sp. C42_A2020_038]|nr:AAA family ATPase [Calothrix sp. C42_A2020_038]
MKLISISLCNFRSFYGKTPEIFLAVNEVKNTTVIHGNNGVGKTSLLNAFTWALYEKFSAAFASAEQLVNKRAVAEAGIGQGVECYVEITWEHDGKRYRAKRQCRVYRSAADVEAGKTELYMLVTGDDGRWYVPDQQPEEIINQILPCSLHQYFFFDGERIEKIVRNDKKAEIAEATKMLLGVEVINRSIRHLGEAKRVLEGELRAIGNSEVKKLLGQQTKIEFEVEAINRRQQEIQQEIEYQSKFKIEVGNRLHELSAAKELQQRRQDLESRKNSLQQQLRKSKDNLKRLISSQCYSVLLLETNIKFRSIIDNLKESGLKPGISREFIIDLLNGNKCICGSYLHDHSQARKHVEHWLEKAGSSTVEETLIRMTAQVDELDKQAVSFWQEVDREQVRINEARQTLGQVDSELLNINEKLRKDPSEEIRDIQKRIDDIEAKISELTFEQGRNQQQSETLNIELDNLNKQIAKQKLNEERQLLAQRRIGATQDAIDRLSEVKTRQEKHFRYSLEQRVQEIFSAISPAPYIPKISEKYELTLVENTLGVEMPVAASTGENQILSLSFISSIIDKVREWSEKKKMLSLPESSTFPIVMDSPFGSLDEISRRHIAKIVPQMANQLVVLVTKTQWRGELQEEIANRVGKEYVLIYHSSKPDCEQDYIELQGERYPLIRQSPNEFEYTEIVEVRNG